LESWVLAEPVLVGRERELEELSRDLQTAMEGRGRTIFISAEAGIGKTRLVTEFLNSVKKENITKLSGWCLFKAGVPYFPFIEAFSNYYSTASEKGSKEEAELNSWLKGDPIKFQ
jgi:predicted ATPase